MERNHLCNFERGHHGEHSYEVIWNLDKWLLRRCRLKKMLMDERMHDRQRSITIAHHEPFCSGELKQETTKISKKNLTCKELRTVSTFLPLSIYYNIYPNFPASLASSNNVNPNVGFQTLLFTCTRLIRSRFKML